MSFNWNCAKMLSGLELWLLSAITMLSNILHDKYFVTHITMNSLADMRDYGHEWP